MARSWAANYQSIILEAICINIYAYSRFVQEKKVQFRMSGRRDIEDQIKVESRKNKTKQRIRNSCENLYIYFFPFANWDWYFLSIPQNQNNFLPTRLRFLWNLEFIHSWLHFTMWVSLGRTFRRKWAPDSVIMFMPTELKDTSKATPWDKPWVVFFLVKNLFNNRNLQALGFFSLSSAIFALESTNILI